MREDGEGREEADMTPSLPVMAERGSPERYVEVLTAQYHRMSPSLERGSLQI